MTGSITQRGDRFRIQVYLGTVDGKRQFHTETLGSREAAEARLVELAQDRQNAHDAKLTVSRLLDQWLVEHVNIECRPQTRASYEIWAAKLRDRIGDRLAHQVTPSQLLKMYGSLRPGLSRTSVRHIHRTLSAAYSHAVAFGRLDVNPCRQLPRGRVPKGSTPRATCLTQEQLQEYLDLFRETAIYPLVALAAVTGLRRGELCGLKWKDIDFQTRQLHVRRTVVKVGGLECSLQPTKTEGSERTIRLPDSALALLRDHRASLALPVGADPQDAPVFPTRDLAHRSPIGLSKEVSRVQQARGVELPLGLHTLRHTHASHLLAARLSPKAVAERLGHSDVTTTLRVYAHVLREQEDDVINVIDGLVHPHMFSDEKKVLRLAQ